MDKGLGEQSFECGLETLVVRSRRNGLGFGDDFPYERAVARLRIRARFTQNVFSEHARTSGPQVCVGPGSGIGALRPHERAESHPSRPDPR